MSQNTQEYAQQLLSKMVYPDMPADEGLRLVQTNIARAEMPGFADGGEVEQEQESTASKILKEVVPMDLRILGSTLFGNREPITESNFNKEELAAMQQAVDRAATRTGKTQKGSVQYVDYPKGDEIGPGYQPVGHTLGRFVYEKGPDGSTVITDKYDFYNEGRKANVEKYEKMGRGEKALSVSGNMLKNLVTGNLRQVPGELADAYIGRDGREVRIKLPVKRSEGSPEEGERLTPQQIEQIAAQEAMERENASSPAFLTPKSGKGRQISTKPGELEGAALQGVSEMPYLLAGAPVDLATMAMRPFGYDVEKPMFGSDDLKQRALAAGIRQKPPEGKAARALYEMGQLGASVVNPAAPVRGAVAVAGKTGEAAKRLASDFQQYNQQISAPGASYAVPPQGRAMAPAPASNLGFYSAAEQAALNLPRKEGPGNAFLNDLMKASDVKKEELEFMGLDAFLRGKPKVTRQEVQDFISNNRIDVKEVQLGGNIVRDPVGLAKRKEVFDKYEPEIQSLYKQMAAAASDAVPVGQSSPWDQLYEKITEIQRIRDREADAAYVIPESLPTRFNRPTLVLPGGANYREILLTMPSGVRGADATRLEELNRLIDEKKAGYDALSESERRAVRDEIKPLRDERTAIQDKKVDYRSSHFDQPNILAHMRVNDRVDADGKKMLLIEEIQSDWHQAGREAGYGDSIKEGYKLSEQEPGFFHLIRQGSSMPVAYGSKEDVMSQARKIGAVAPGVPDAPFKDTWHQLALKRAIKYAADNGYERVGLTTGKQQSKRYNLGEQVDNITYEPTEKGFYINVISKDGPNVLNGDYTVKELEGIVGKELTQKMLAKEGKNEFNPEIEPDLAEIRRLDGVDLQLEDKGMKKYYDEIYPAFLEKQAKRFNAASGTTRIKTGRGVPGGEPVRFVDITPEMQGAVPYAKGGAVERQPSDNRRYL